MDSWYPARDLGTVRPRQLSRRQPQQQETAAAAAEKVVVEEKEEEEEEMVVEYGELEGVVPCRKEKAAIGGLTAAPSLQPLLVRAKECIRRNGTFRFASTPFYVCSVPHGVCTILGYAAGDMLPLLG